MPIEQALDWANGGWKSSPYAKVESAGFGINVDGNFGFQCADFVTAYSIFLGTPFNDGVVRNAITLWEDQPGWHKVASPQPGDVFVRDAVFEGVNYGDAGIVTSVTDKGVYVIQQNLKADLYHGSPPNSFFWRFKYIKGFIRSNNIGDNAMQADIDELNKQLNQTNTYLQATQAAVVELTKQLDSTNTYLDSLTKRVTALEGKPTSGGSQPSDGTYKITKVS